MYKLHTIEKKKQIMYDLYLLKQRKILFWQTWRVSLAGRYSHESTARGVATCMVSQYPEMRFIIQEQK